jgi:hypothetical protein
MALTNVWPLRKAFQGFEHQIDWEAVDSDIEKRTERLVELRRLPGRNLRYSSFETWTAEDVAVVGRFFRHHQRRFDNGEPGAEDNIFQWVDSDPMVSFRHRAHPNCVLEYPEESAFFYAAMAKSPLSNDAYMSAPGLGTKRIFDHQCLEIIQALRGIAPNIMSLLDHLEYYYVLNPRPVSPSARRYTGTDSSTLRRIYRWLSQQSLTLFRLSPRQQSICCVTGSFHLCSQTYSRRSTTAGLSHESIDFFKAPHFAAPSRTHCTEDTTVPTDMSSLLSE